MSRHFILDFFTFSLISTCCILTLPSLLKFCFLNTTFCKVRKQKLLHCYCEKCFEFVNPIFVLPKILIQKFTLISAIFLLNVGYFRSAIWNFLLLPSFSNSVTPNTFILRISIISESFSNLASFLGVLDHSAAQQKRETLYPRVTYNVEIRQVQQQRETQYQQLSIQLRLGKRCNNGRLYIHD